MKILIVGGTGFIGSAIAKAITSENKHEVLILSRNSGRKGVMEKVLSAPPLSAEAVDFVNMDIPVDGSAAEKIFNYKMKSLEEALRSYLFA
jgi:nucleoside-diphosphate-sugar epimerase